MCEAWREYRGQEFQGPTLTERRYNGFADVPSGCSFRPRLRVASSLNKIKPEAKSAGLENSPCKSWHRPFLLQIAIEILRAILDSGNMSGQFCTV
jgi:hypothetical protein